MLDGLVTAAITLNFAVPAMTRLWDFRAIGMYPHGRHSCLYSCGGTRGVCEARVQKQRQDKKVVEVLDRWRKRCSHAPVERLP